jgi:tetratricopeptide (TPR) repeat protein
VRARGVPYGLLIVFGLAVTLAASALARADVHDKKTAAAHFKRGSTLFEDARYHEALAAFKAGYDAFPLPGFLVNIGQCYRKLERYEDAADVFKRFLETNPSDGRLRAEVEEAFAEVKQEIVKRLDAEEARKKAAEAERRSLLEGIARNQAQAAGDNAASRPTSRPAAVVPAPVPAPVPAGALEVRSQPDAPKKKSRWWVWTIVGVAAAGAVAAAVTVGVVETQAQNPRAGTLGLIDGRR